MATFKLGKREIGNPAKNREAVDVESPTLKRLLSRLRQLRKVHDLTQEQFSELSGISYKYYQAVEAGRKRDLRLSTLDRLATAYGVEVWQLAGGVVHQYPIPLGAGFGGLGGFVNRELNATCVVYEFGSSGHTQPRTHFFRSACFETVSICFNGRVLE